MLVFVAVDAQQFPVAAIRRVVIMVVVAMMHRELLQIVAVFFLASATMLSRRRALGVVMAVRGERGGVVSMPVGRGKWNLTRVVG